MTSPPPPSSTSSAAPSVGPRPARMDAYSRHPLRGPLYPGQSTPAIVPIDPNSGAYRSARLNQYSPFINVHPSHVDGRVPPRRPRMPLNFRTGGGLAVQAGSQGARSGQAPMGTSGDHLWSHRPFTQAASRVLIVNPMHIVNLSEHTKSRLIRFIETLKRFSEKWFSHVLLLLFLAIYACLGAYVFISFEAYHEHNEKQAIIDLRMKIVNDGWNARDRLKPAFFELMRMRFEEYERQIYKACAMGMSTSSLDQQWTFWGALFYSMTVFTTIGYGHLTPVTFGGRIATMIYAIFGIPILLMVLADLGKLLTRVIKYAFNKLRLMFWRLFRRKGAQKTRKIISDNTNQYIGVAKDAFEKGFAYIPYVPQALRSNSLKKHHDKQQQQQQFNDNNEGQTQTTSVIVTTSAPSPPVSPNTDPKSPNLLSSSGSKKQRRNSGRIKKTKEDASPASLESASTVELDENGKTQTGPNDPAISPEAPAFEDIDDEFDLPVSVALTLLVMYMMFGAIIFSAWEGWFFFDSLYFVFISMSTIGFGDLVPQHPQRMMATFIYLLFGLALTSMCINVVQEKIHATFLRAKMQIGEKMGLDLEQIMADDYYEDGYDDDEDMYIGHDGLSNDDNKSATNTISEPSSANNSMKGRKKSTTSSPGKDDRRKISGTGGGSPIQQQQQQQQQLNRRTPSNLSNEAQNHQQPIGNGVKSPLSTLDNNDNSNADDNNKKKLRTTQSQPNSLGKQNNSSTSNNNNNNNNNNNSNNDTRKTTAPPSKKSTYELELKPAKQPHKPVIDQLDEPMAPPRSRWGSGKFSVV